MTNIGNIRLTSVGVFLIIVGVLYGLTACNAETGKAPALAPAPTPTPVISGKELYFETIEQADGGTSYYENEDEALRGPHIILITTQNEISLLANLTELVSPEVMDRLHMLDFEQYFVIALFRGDKPSSGYDIFIERIVQYEKRLTIYAQFYELSPDHGITPMATSPYHIVKVLRDDAVDLRIPPVLQSQLVTPTPPSF